MNDPVRWTPAHVAELEQAFPEEFNSSDTSVLLQNSGRRHVVDYVRSRCKHQQKKVQDNAK